MCKEFKIRWLDEDGKYGAFIDFSLASSLDWELLKQEKLTLMLLKG